MPRNARRRHRTKFLFVSVFVLREQGDCTRCALLPKASHRSIQKDSHRATAIADHHCIENVITDPTLRRTIQTRVTAITLHALIAALALAVFYVDAMIEHGVAAGVLYAAVIGLTVWLPGTRSTLGYGLVALVLTLFDYVVSVDEGPLWKAVANRLFSLFAIAVTAALVWHHKRLSLERDDAEQRAARSAQKFRLTVESSSVGMLLVDHQGRIALVNAEAERLFGYAPNELVGQPIEVLVPKFNRAEHATQRSGFIARGIPRRMGGGREIRGAHKDGHELTLDVGLGMIETIDGAFVLATVTDIGGRKQLEKARGERTLARRLIEAEEAERKRMAREIHDALGQALTALKLDAGWLAGRLLVAGRADLSARATEMEALAADTIQEVRRLSAKLRPTVLDDQGLLAAIRWQVGDFEKHTGLRCALALPDSEIAWDPEHCTVAYRVLQESLTNVARHAQASKVSVALWRERQGDMVLEVCDDGRGISEQGADQESSLGLRGMRERALLHDGLLTITGVEGGGTTVLLRLPSQQRKLPGDRRLRGRDRRSTSRGG